MIDVIDVTHHYGVRPVLQRVSLHVRQGEVVALMGPNGMGKSTLMGVIAGTLCPATGHVDIAGLRRRRSPDEELQIRRQVVFLPVDAWLPRLRTAREWMFAVGRLYKVNDDRLMDHVPRLLSLFNLDAQADQPIAAGSTGQRKKIALACALVAEAPIMLLDEPFAGGLDPSGILALQRVLQHHRERQDRTIVIATPVPELVEEVANRIAVIRDGRVVAFDTPDGLRRTTGCAGRLAEVYERIASPQGMRGIEQYLQMR